MDFSCLLSRVAFAIRTKGGHVAVLPKAVYRSVFVERVRRLVVSV